VPDAFDLSTLQSALHLRPSLPNFDMATPTPTFQAIKLHGSDAMTARDYRIQKRAAVTQQLLRLASSSPTLDTARAVDFLSDSSIEHAPAAPWLPSMQDALIALPLLLWALGDLARKLLRLALPAAPQSDADQNGNVVAMEDFLRECRRAWYAANPDECPCITTDRLHPDQLPHPGESLQKRVKLSSVAAASCNSFHDTTHEQKEQLPPPSITFLDDEPITPVYSNTTTAAPPDRWADDPPHPGFFIPSYAASSLCPGSPSRVISQSASQLHAPARSVVPTRKRRCRHLQTLGR
jgi:hypothetical protein